MPCEQCEEGKYKWGQTGECQYETLEDCQLANQGEYLEETLKPKSDKPVDFTYNFTKDQMEELHEDGELMVEVGRDDDEPMIILFTYEKREEEEELEEDIKKEKEEEEEIYAKSRLNSKGYDKASSLVESDNIDRDSDWSFTSEDGNALLGEDGDDWENYAKWFLLENEDASEDTKDRYKFPYGKDGKIYRSALSAIRQRASQFGYDDVFEAAGKLIEMIDKEDDKLENAYSNLTKSMLDDELDDYINRITNAIKKL
jgi:MoaA/NifB/PqqE/SkfB family radical SAM enzyme